MSFNRFAGSASDGQLRAVPTTVCDGYRVTEKGEAVVALWCRDCVAGRCTCPLIATRTARQLTRKHRSKTVVDGLIGGEWTALKVFSPVVEGGARG